MFRIILFGIMMIGTMAGDLSTIEQRLTSEFPSEMIDDYLNFRSQFVKCNNRLHVFFTRKKEHKIVEFVFDLQERKWSKSTNSTIPYDGETDAIFFCARQEIFLVTRWKRYVKATMYLYRQMDDQWQLVDENDQLPPAKQPLYIVNCSPIPDGLQCYTKGWDENQFLITSISVNKNDNAESNDRHSIKYGLQTLEIPALQYEASGNVAVRMTYIDQDKTLIWSFPFDQRFQWLQLVIVRSDPVHGIKGNSTTYRLQHDLKSKELNYFSYAYAYDGRIYIVQDKKRYAGCVLWPLDIKTGHADSSKKAFVRFPSHNLLFDQTNGDVFAFEKNGVSKFNLKQLTE